MKQDTESREPPSVQTPSDAGVAAPAVEDVEPAAPVRSDSYAVPPVPPVPAPGSSPVEVAADDEVERQIHALSRRSFLWGGVAAVAGFTGWRWLVTRRTDNGIPWPFRRVLNIDDDLAHDFYRTSRLSPTFPEAMARGDARLNGDIGLGDDFDPAQWKLNVEGLAHGDGPTVVTLAQIKALRPVVTMVTELKCIEGWSIFVKWTGVRLSDFMAKYPPATKSGDPPDVLHKPQDLVSYVSLSTPDEGYYVGLDMDSALHPQTLLCYAMNDKPLTLDHGAPLRLAIPVKYGIKNIKRIGTIKFTDQRPADYWAEQGYDWYAGH